MLKEAGAFTLDSVDGDQYIMSHSNLYMTATIPMDIREGSEIQVDLFSPINLHESQIESLEEAIDHCGRCQEAYREMLGIRDRLKSLGFEGRFEYYEPVSSGLRYDLTADSEEGVAAILRQFS